MTVVVTGGAGFIGSHIVDVLLERGLSVVVVDDLRLGKPHHLSPHKNARHIAASVHDIKRFPEDTSIVVHCAAIADIAGNWADGMPERIVHENIVGTMRALDATPAGAAFMLLSTCAVYGSGEASDRCHVGSPYAASKIAAEAMVQAYAERKALQWGVARLVSCVGSRYHHGHIADFVRKASLGVVQALDDGANAKSFVHVQDVAEVVASMAIDAYEQHMLMGIVNVSSRQLWSWRDTITIMRETAPVEVHAFSTDRGWVGDPVGLKVQPHKHCNRPVESGVRDALRDLGWPLKK